MPIISQIGRRSAGVRVLLGAIYVVLSLGALTMLYPFVLMVSGSTKSAVDMKDVDVIPAFLRDDLALYRKHIEGLFNESLDALNSTYDTDFTSFERTMPPAQTNVGLVDEWWTFLRESPPESYAVAGGYLAAPVSRTEPSGLREFKRTVADRYGSDISVVNQALGCDFVGWNAFFVNPENYLPRIRMPQATSFWKALQVFKAGQPRGLKYCPSPEGAFKRQYLKSLYSRDIAAYNRAHGTRHSSYDEIHLARRMPKGAPLEQEDWEDFVRASLNLLWVRADETALPLYRDFLTAKYRTLEALNRNYQATYDSFSDVPLVEEPPFGGVVLSDWAAVISGWRDPDSGREYRIPVESLSVYSVEFRFRDHLERKYGTIEALNAALETAFGRFLDILPPQRQAHHAEFLASRRALRWEFATRNYKAVVDYVLLHGRGFANTAIYCSLAVLFSLIVNPLAAYAMSRFRMPSTYKILLFLMLTMAFPPMVTQIPVFLMLRKLSLLNTFAALILPGLASGYSIFLLKGFFDSLPRDLYDSAAMDGASEWTVFWTLTMSLSKPILSVIALQAFTSAYANFIYALLICQDERMWTLMVWLYQLQERSGQGVIYASLLIAAIPTFILFVLCQKIILRGIVVPVEK
jgi:ABC-type glycerol-3-phosphate transport system permease component